jgi:hypothetical protein
MVYFPEPTSPDESWPGWDETAVEWFTRSTQPRAKAVREFLNRSLEHFPPKHARSLAKRLNQDWQSFFFEIVVGRYLQVLGAEVEPEPRGSNGTHVDFRATFPGGIVVSVECVSKRFNLEAQKTIQRHGKMARMLDDVGPTNWAIEFHELPESDSPIEFQPYVRAARDWYKTLPKPLEGGPRPTFGFEGGGGRMVLEAIPFPEGTMPNHLGPGVAWMDDSIQRLKDALIDSHKRKQARGAVPPVFLAIDCPFNGPDAEDFDQALFGLTVDHRGFDWRESVGTSFNPNGLLVADRDIPFAGVLAFLKMSMVGAADPVIYLNPYQRWKLPTALACHERRVWTSGIEKTLATREPVIGSIGFVQLGCDD